MVAGERVEEQTAASSSKGKSLDSSTMTRATRWQS